MKYIVFFVLPERINTQKMFKIEPGSANPWNHKKLEDFLFFNCPECHFKSQNGDDFLIHCHDHPLGKKKANIKFRNDFCWLFFKHIVFIFSL